MPDARILERTLAIHMLLTRLEGYYRRAVIGRGILIVDEALRHVDGHPSRRINDGDKALKIQANSAMDRDSKILLHRLHCQIDAATLVLSFAKDMSAVDPILSVAGNIDIEIAR